MRAFAVLAPIVFVVLWSTGFIGARATVPYVEPMTLLSVRFLTAAVLLALVASAFRFTWPRSRSDLVHNAVAGLLMQSVYLGGVFSSVWFGLEAGASALIVGIQPVLTAAFAGPILGEKVTIRKWLGLTVGLLGVILVVLEKLWDGLGTPFAVFLAVLGLIGISIGTLYQKKYCSEQPIISGMVIQYVAAGLSCGLFALLLESNGIILSTELVIGFLWLTLVLSCLVVCLLYWLIRQGAATNVASLFFLVPPFAALFVWLLYGEELGPQAILGMVLVGFAVLFVNTGNRLDREAST